MTVTDLRNNQEIISGNQGVIQNQSVCGHSIALFLMGAFKVEFTEIEIRSMLSKFYSLKLYPE